MMRKRKSSSQVNHERWLVSYADFITLLFAFFVVMFASSQVDKRKVGKVSVAMQEAFQALGIFQAANSRTPVVAAKPLPAENVQPIEDGKGILGQGQLTPVTGKLPTSPSEDLGAVERRLTAALAKEIQRHEVVLRMNREGLVISLREMGFFDSGSAGLRPAAVAAVQRIVEVLRAQSNNIRIEGHTDNVPIHNAQFASNWELSTARATEMIRLFITQFNLPAARLSAAGYAEYHPAASNDTPDGRAQNRRVDIVVLASSPDRLGLNSPSVRSTP
jgi:chemotaxis protein MotB